MSRKKPYFKVRNYFESAKLVTNSILCSLFPACILSIGHPLSVTNSFFKKKRKKTTLCQWLLLEPGLFICTRDRAGEFPVGEINRPQTATGVVAK